MADVRPRSALIIESDVRARLEIADFLLMRGLLVLCCAGAQEALDLLRDGLTPDVLVFDARRSTVELAMFGRSQQAPDLPTVTVVASPPPPDHPGSAPRGTGTTLEGLADAISVAVAGQTPLVGPAPD